MHRRLLTSLAIVALAVVSGCPPKAPPVGPGALTPKEVVVVAKATIEQWRQAHEVRSMEALAQVYARDVDLVVVQQGAVFLGWSSVEAMLTDRLSTASAIHIRLKDVQVASLAPDVATMIATMSREITQGATTVTENGTMTIVLRKQGDRWVITSEHYSYKRPS